MKTVTLRSVEMHGGQTTIYLADDERILDVFGRADPDPTYGGGGGYWPSGPPMISRVWVVIAKEVET